MQGQLWGLSIYRYKGLQCFRKIHLGEERWVKVICLFSWHLSTLPLPQNFQVGLHAYKFHSLSVWAFFSPQRYHIVSFLPQKTMSTNTTLETLKDNFILHIFFSGQPYWILLCSQWSFFSPHQIQKYLLMCRNTNDTMNALIQVLSPHTWGLTLHVCTHVPLTQPTSTTVSTSLWPCNTWHPGKWAWAWKSRNRCWKFPHVCWNHMLVQPPLPLFPEETQLQFRAPAFKSSS